MTENPFPDWRLPPNFSTVAVTAFHELLYAVARMSLATRAHLAQTKTPNDTDPHRRTLQQAAAAIARSDLEDALANLEARLVELNRITRHTGRAILIAQRVTREEPNS